MGKKFHLVTIGLLLLLGLRLVAHLEPALAARNLAAVLAFFLYLTPLVGVILRRRWGPVMSGIVGILDLGMTLFYVRGMNTFGAAVADVLLILLSYLDYRQLTRKEHPGDTGHEGPPPCESIS